MGKLINPDLMIDVLNMDLIKCKIQNKSIKKKKRRLEKIECSKLGLW